MQELATVTQTRFRCRHIHAAGHQCGSPALRHEHFCYYHHATRRPAAAGPKFRHLDAAEPFTIPIVEDRVSALQVASQILSRIASNDLDPTRAGKLIYCLQIITAFLPKEPRANATNRTNAATPNRAAAAAASESPEPKPTPEPLVEEIVLDEIHGPIAPLTELTSVAVPISELPPSSTVVILSAAKNPRR